MQSELRVALIQKDLVWQNAAKNKEKLDNLLSEIESVDLVVLPEMFTTGFSMEPTYGTNKPFFPSF